MTVTMGGFHWPAHGHTAITGSLAAIIYYIERGATGCDVRRSCLGTPPAFEI